jgi:geranylgeranyl reductase family protein
MCDVLIVGAGPAGSALAYWLAREGVRVRLLDKAHFPRDKTCGDGLTPRAVYALHTLGALPAVERAGFRVNRSRLIGPRGEGVETPLSPSTDLPDYALVLPRRQLDALLVQHAQSAGVRFQPQVTVTDVIRLSAGHVGVRAESADGALEMEARYVFIATGAATALLKRAGLLRHSPVFMRAARAYFEPVRDLTGVFEFYFTGHLLPGYGWVFPTSATTANIGVTVIEHAGHSAQTGLDTLLAHPILAARVKGARRLGPVQGYPLRIDFPDAQTVFPGVALVGEAAGLVNPLTGEGIDYALESAEIAARVFGPVLREGRPAVEVEPRYAEALRGRFAHTFRRCRRVRDWGLRPWAVTRGVAVAQRRAAFRRMVTLIAHGSQAPARRDLLQAAWQFALG